MDRTIQKCGLLALMLGGGAGLLTFLIAPGHAPEAAKAPFRGRNFAHRGLHRADRSVPENSMAAFQEAIERGYGIELDLRLTADGRVVVFHDDTLRRVCGVSASVEELTWDSLKPLLLGRTEEHIPLLSQVLALVDGKAPLVLELKRSVHNRALCRRTAEILRHYHGDYCVQSFDPTIVRWWRRHAPEVLRGQLSRPAAGLRPHMGVLGAFLLSRVLTNCLGRPQFISYSLEGKKPWTVRCSERMGAMRFAWTSHSRDNEAGNDAVIFEYYRPVTKF